MENFHILVVEDELICMGFIQQTLSPKGFTVIPVHNCSDAWLYLENQTHDVDAILLDRGLPDQDGLIFLRRLKATPAYQNIPVIVETVSADDESIRQGLASGAYYYLTKPLNADLLIGIINAAIDQYRSEQALKKMVRLKEESYCQHLSQAVFHFRTLDQAKNLAQVLSQLCPEPERVIMGLQELLINAVEHGNLGITYAEKTRLILENQWREEVERRQLLPECSTRQVEIHFQRHATHVVMTVQDEGVGFDWEKYLQFDPERAFDPHGRGIALANMMSFDGLTYLGNGNTVEVKINL